MDQKLQGYIKDNRQELFDLLRELVLIQSYSRNKKGVDRVGQRIALEIGKMGFSLERSKQENLGDHLIARSPGYEPGKKQILITGHMDTVFPEESSFNWYKEDDHKCFGPGVADMKGGLVVGIFALKALIHTGKINTLPITFIFNSDEEIGSPTSRALIREEADKARLAYVLEAGGLAGEIVSGRKGNFSARLSISGKAGHAAFAGRDKASAILELAHKTLAIEALNAPEKGISANVGTVQGGIGPNTVPDLAKAALDFRFLSDSDGADLKNRLSGIIEDQTVPGTRAEMEIVSGRPAMPQTRTNRDLFEKIRTLANDLETPVVEELRQGVSDANIIASRGIPVIDGLGPLGAKDHSEDEFIDRASLWERSVLFANILAEI